MVSLNRDSGWNACRSSFVERGDRTWGPVVYAANLASQATLKQVAVLAEVVQQAGKSRLIAGPEVCGIPRGAFRDGHQMFSQWFGAAGAVRAVGE
jgi:hypothetical protein